MVMGVFFERAWPQWNDGWDSGKYPLVNCHIANWKITILNRSINYKSGIFNSYVKLPEGIPEWPCDNDYFQGSE